MDNVISLLLNNFNAYNLFFLKEISLFITFDFFFLLLYKFECFQMKP